MLFLLTAPGFALLFPLLKIPKLREQRLTRLSRGFREALGMVGSYLSAGYAVPNAFTLTADRLKKMFGDSADISVEFSAIASGILLQIPAEELLRDFGMRSGNRDIFSFSELFYTAGKTGGSLTDSIDRTVSILREKSAVAEEIDSMTASRRLEQKIMNVLPFFLILYLDVSSPGLLDAMYTTGIGRVIMTVSLFLTFLALILSEKIMRIRL